MNRGRQVPKYGTKCGNKLPRTSHPFNAKWLVALINQFRKVRIKLDCWIVWEKDKIIIIISFSFFFAWSV